MGHQGYGEASSNHRQPAKWIYRTLEWHDRQSLWHGPDYLSSIEFRRGNRKVQPPEKEDYPALVEHCGGWAAKYPDDPHAQIMLAQAYVLNGEYHKPIDLPTPYHRQDPSNMGYHHAILDALFAMGKTEDDFEWTAKPPILRMSHSVLDSCFKFLKPRKKPRSVSELYCEFIPKRYPLFSKGDLLGALLRDKRFAVINAHEGCLAKVQVAREEGRTQSM